MWHCGIYGLSNALNICLLHLIHSDNWYLYIIFKWRFYNQSRVQLWPCCSLLSDHRHNIYSLSSSVDLRCVKQIDAIFIGQSHQLLCHLVREQGWEGQRGERPLRTFSINSN